MRQVDELSDLRMSCNALPAMQQNVSQSLNEVTEAAMGTKTQPGLQGVGLQHENLADRLLEMVTMVTMGGDLRPGRLADRLVAGLWQPKINP
eukprot:1131885-Pelagomonas_calceolata.AAC.3